MLARAGLDVNPRALRDGMTARKKSAQKRAFRKRGGDRNNRSPLNGTDEAPSGPASATTPAAAAPQQGSAIVSQRSNTRPRQASSPLIWRTTEVAIHLFYADKGGCGKSFLATAFGE
jgi:hypothetical protein